MNRLYVDQLAYLANRAKYSAGFQDIEKAKTSLQWMIDKLHEYLDECPNVENGACSTFWRYEDCNILMKILYDITVDPKYRTKY